MMRHLYKPSKSFSPVILILFFILTFSIEGITQSFSLSNDLKFIQKNKLKVEKHTHVRPYIFKNEPKSFKTLNPISLTYGGLLFIYQNSISQHFSADCLYQPSCSDFSKQCVHQYGLIKGGLLTLDRLNRCNRIAGADIRPSEIDPKTQNCNDPISRYK